MHAALVEFHFASVVMYVEVKILMLLLNLSVIC